MPAPSSYHAALRVLSARARRLNARAGGRALPALYFFTDPARTPDPVRAARALPRGAAIVYRAFADPRRLAVARALRRLADRRGLALLIGNDERLALRTGADGVHLSERAAVRATALRRRRRDWIITAAAHSPRALARAARAGADGAFMSPVFATASHPGQPPIGARRAAAWVRGAQLPVFALGGLDARSAGRLAGRFAGLAATGALTAPSTEART